MMIELRKCCDAQSWDAFFRNVSNDISPSLSHVSTNSAHEMTSVIDKQVSQATSNVPSKLIDDHLVLQAIIREYQVETHCITFYSYTYRLLSLY